MKNNQDMKAFFTVLFSPFLALFYCKSLDQELREVKAKELQAQLDYEQTKRRIADQKAQIQEDDEQFKRMLLEYQVKREAHGICLPWGKP